MERETNVRITDLIIDGILDWAEQLASKRDEFGLTDIERRQVLEVAKCGEVGRDRAEELACHGFGISTSQFYSLLHDAGISAR